MMSNVVVLTNFRTASTTFTLIKSEEYNLPYKGELFSHEKPHQIGSIPGVGELVRDGVSNHNQNLIYSRWNIHTELAKGHAACYKIMPSHFKGNSFQLETVLKNADKVYYLYRRDFMAQIKSWMEVRLSGSFDKTGFATNVAVDQRDGLGDPYVRRMHQVHRGTYMNAETYRNTVDPNCHDFTNSKTDVETKALVKQLVGNYETMSDMYKRVPGVLVCYEDYFSGDSYKPYNREITWTSEPQVNQYVPNWDIESYFK